MPKASACEVKFVLPSTPGTTKPSLMDYNDTCVPRGRTFFCFLTTVTKSLPLPISASIYCCIASSLEYSSWILSNFYYSLSFSAFSWRFLSPSRNSHSFIVSPICSHCANFSLCKNLTYSSRSSQRYLNCLRPSGSERQAYCSLLAFSFILSLIISSYY